MVDWAGRWSISWGSDWGKRRSLKVNLELILNEMSRSVIGASFSYARYAIAVWYAEVAASHR